MTMCHRQGATLHLQLVTKRNITVTLLYLQVHVWNNNTSACKYITPVLVRTPVLVIVVLLFCFSSQDYASHSVNYITFIKRPSTTICHGVLLPNEVPNHLCVYVYTKCSFNFREVIRLMGKKSTEPYIAN